MSVERRIRRDFPNPELAMARVFRARKEYECALCSRVGTIQALPIDDNGATIQWRGPRIFPNEVYARISETRVPICSAHFTIDDVVSITKERKP